MAPSSIQDDVDAAYLSEEARDLTLFHYYGCFYCERVRGALADLGLVVAEKNILQDIEARQEIVEARGRRTVPVLKVETPDGIEYIGESRDIVRYLYDRFGEDDKAAPSPRADIDFWLRIGMWALLAAGGLYADGRLVLWSLALGVAGGRSLLSGWRSGAIAHYLIGGVFTAAAIATIAEGLGWGTFEWWWLAFAIIPVLALPAVRRSRVR